ncbi:hypothetical protein BGW41_001052 [Actinomortierella wolfii]|nr:hypothetical protein BGW41_001052 [Actinomortierella wolfii]
MTKENVLFMGTVRHGKAKEAELAQKYNLHYATGTRQELIEYLDKAKQDGIIFRALYRGFASHYTLGRVDKELLDHFPEKLEIIGSVGAGYDFVDAQQATLYKQWVTNTPGVVDDATADAAVLLLLSTLRHQYEIEYNLRHVEPVEVHGVCSTLICGEESRLTLRNVTQKSTDAGIKTKPRIGRDPTGMTLGIVGMGGIGKAFAKRAYAMGMKIIYYNRKPVEVSDSDDIAIRSATYTQSLEDLLKQSDVVSLHVPLSDATRHLITAKELAMMKPGSYLLNTARGPVVDEQALVDALERGHLAGAGLDVFEREPEVHPWLLQSMNVSLMPHLGAYTIGAISKMETRAMENVDAYLSTGKPLTPVNKF